MRCLFIHLSVRLSIRLSIRLSVNISHKVLLLPHFSADFRSVYQLFYLIALPNGHIAYT